ncbi:threonine synthase [Paenibacillus sp. UNCCL117]|uniref:threonine synthase n=1 Tax=unclassified Paenibacillus TaxID=185978 RepID=UPI000880D0E9|nr:MULTISPECIES: threonine synthase [unclassified Paenibacillus]SDD49554.1 threonine synthase [Paenibacillus sp. cl123]SFW49939.1 threonine synthase [Paenibacillus sp. UNCCL117]
MKYISTRGQVAPIGFIDAVLMGLADDGGLLVPEHLPQIPEATLKQWQKLTYPELALEVFSLFTDGEIPREDLKKLVDDSYSTFRHEEVTPVRELEGNRHVLELFHGPTFAFKDVALQFLGNLYSYVSRRTNSIIHILGATSGDTGASAIEGVRGKEGIRICILHPHQKVSKVQELQMTTVDDANVLNLAVEGTFDDCQRIIKELFADVGFKHQYHLRAINSINIARILAQTVYYFYAYFRLADKGMAGKVSFSVPTGNFGDIFAGYLAQKMGLPIHKLILATNENNILARFVNEGVYQPGDFRGTYSPSMDIQVASNFERYLYYLHGEDAAKVASLMAQFKAEGRLVIEGDSLKQVQADFAAYSVENEECLNTISEYYEKHEYLLDPHTACGAAAADKLAEEGEAAVVLSTAHPAKFDEAIRLRRISQTYPEPIQALFDKPQLQTVVGGTNEEIKEQLVKFF